MQIWAVSMVKDEADIVLSMLSQLVNEGVDGFVIADNGSTDGTRELIHSFISPVPLIIKDDTEVAYYQSKKMTNLAKIAHDNGASWILPVDADEIWYNKGDRITDYIREHDSWLFKHGVWSLSVNLYNHFRTGLDLDNGDVVLSMPYRQKDPAPLTKVACRYKDDMVIQMGNHSVTYSDKYDQYGSPIEIRHFPYRSPEQMIRKSLNGGKAYAASDLPVSQGAHWRQYAELIERYGEERFIKDVWEKYYYFSPTDSSLIYDPAPYLRWK